MLEAVNLLIANTRTRRKFVKKIEELKKKTIPWKILSKESIIHLLTWTLVTSVIIETRQSRETFSRERNTERSRVRLLWVEINGTAPLSFREQLNRRFRATSIFRRVRRDPKKRCIVFSRIIIHGSMSPYSLCSIKKLIDINVAQWGIAAKRYEFFSSLLLFTANIPLCVA